MGARAEKKSSCYIIFKEMYYIKKKTIIRIISKTIMILFFLEILRKKVLQAYHQHSKQDLLKDKS